MHPDPEPVEDDFVIKRKSVYNNEGNRKEMMENFSRNPMWALKAYHYQSGLYKQTKSGIDDHELEKQLREKKIPEADAPASSG